MPLSGGATDKFGNRYEGRWTVLCMVEVMDEKADSIRLEPPGEEGKGVEFWVSRENNREYHQVKRQQSKGSWTLSDLTNKGVLPNFWEKLKAPTATCVFISSDRAFQLDELADRGRRSASFQEFEREFLIDSGKSQMSERSRNFQDLCKRWNDCIQIEAYEALKKIRVETISEDLLRTIVESRLTALVDGESANVVDVLAQFALDKVHHELTTHTIWHHLDERGFQRRMWGKDPHVLAKVTEANRLYQNPLRDSSIADQAIPRRETQTVLQKLISPTEQKALLVVGEAGVGKSGVMLQICDEVAQQELPFLAFRIDRLEPTLLPDKVGEQLGLPGSPANVLAAIAQKRECVLIIDQLDAVSLASGRNSQFFYCVFEIIKQVQAHPNMRLVLACRKFDLDNDHRLRSLTAQDGVAETVQINRLPHTTVKEVISTKLKLDATCFNERQLDLLSVPLHLNLLAEIAKNSEIDTLDFNTAKDLYDQFWDRKKALIRERCGDSVRWVEVIDKLCDYMSRKQTLSAPKTILDDSNLADDAQTMASEHVLVWSDSRIQFFHESFFDYAFARRFEAIGQTLLTFLLESEQHLFRRAQIRQILHHQRESDFDGYLSNLNELLNSPKIRFHLKQTAFLLLAALNNPTEREWETISQLITGSQEPLAEQAWKVLRISINWFNLLDSLGVVRQWLASSDSGKIEQTISLLAIFQNQLPDRIIELLEPYLDKSEEWQKRLNSFFTRGYVKPGASRKFFELFLCFIQRGIFDHPQGLNDYEHDFWFGISSLSEMHPDWACEAIACYFNHHLELSVAAGQPNLFDYDSGSIPRSSNDDGSLHNSARKAPEKFIETLLPFMFSVIEANAEQSGEPPWQDPIWDDRIYGEGHTIQSKLLHEMEIALSHMSVNSTEAFSDLVEQKLLESDFKTIQYLLIRAYTANAKRYADEAIDYLCQNQNRLEPEYSSCQGNANAAPFWATYQLLKEVTLYCSEDNLTRLENVILNYYTSWEKSVHGRQERGYTQLFLLEALNPLKRSRTSTCRLQEWKRKFISLNWLNSSGNLDIPEQWDILDTDDYLVKSPISNLAASKMTDRQWLKAIMRYSNNNVSFYKSDSFGRLTSGMSQLACVLEANVKIEPKRFANLVIQFPENSNTVYFNAVLRGLVDTEVDVNTAFRVSSHFHKLPSHSCGRQISELIGKLAHLAWSKEAFDIIIWYALTDPEPNQELGDNSSDPFSLGMSTTRGSAVIAIAKLIFADKNRTSYFQEALQKAVNDSSIAVRACVAEALIAVLNYDRNLAVQLFIKLCNSADKLLETSPIKRFLYYALQTHFQELTPILERMVTSDLPKVIKAGAKQASLSFLVQEEAKSLVERCLSGSKDHRKAVARILSVNLRKGYQRDFCEHTLIQLFNDSEQEVRSEAASCFAHFEASELGNHIDLVDKFIESYAFGDSQYQLLRALEKTTAKLPQVIIQVCERVLNNKTSNMNYGIDMSIMSKLLLRVYSQDSSLSFQSRCLDIVDRMTQVGVYDLDQALQIYER
jgi:hypothetical protein